MDVRTKFINDIKCNLYDEFSQGQIEKLEDVLYIKLDDYDIQQKSTDMVPADNSLSAILQQFIVSKSMQGCSDKTIKRYYSQCYYMLNSIGKPIKDITTYDVRLYLTNYKRNHDVSNRTLDGMRRCMNSFFNWCYTEEIINRNPCASISQIKYDKTIRFPFTNVEMEKIKRACPTKRDRALVEFLYATGCRVSEVAALNRADIDFKNQTVVVYGKGGKERVVYITDVAMLYLTEYLEERTDNDGCLFMGKRGRLTKNGIESRLHRLGEIAGVDDVHPHKYRRTLATNLLDRGANIQDVATVLGHEDVKTTQIYCFISQENVNATYNKYIS